MAAMTYSQQLKHPNWQRRRLEMLNEANFTCSDCGGDEVTLHVHHKQYFKGRMAWEYSNDELQVLCEVCHEDAHVVADELKVLLGQVRQSEALSLLHGFYSAADWIDRSALSEGRDRDPLTYATGFSAMLISHLGINDMYEVARYAASLSGEMSEARLIFNGGKNVYGEE
jgi:hypothetical protein